VRAPRKGLGGYSNAALGTAGVAVAIPNQATGFIVNVSAGCWFGLADNNTLSAFADATYGSILSGGPHEFHRQAIGGGAEDFVQIAAWTGTAAVAIAFF